jgi:hypothetical protein
MVVIVDQDEMDGAGSLGKFRSGAEILNNYSTFDECRDFLREVVNDSSLPSGDKKLAIELYAEEKVPQGALSEYRKDVLDIYKSLPEYYHTNALKKHFGSRTGYKKYQKITGGGTHRNLPEFSDFEDMPEGPGANHPQPILVRSKAQEEFLESLEKRLLPMMNSSNPEISFHYLLGYKLYEKLCDSAHDITTSVPRVIHAILVDEKETRVSTPEYFSILLKTGRAPENPSRAELFFIDVYKDLAEIKNNHSPDKN